MIQTSCVSVDLNPEELCHTLYRCASAEHLGPAIALLMRKLYSEDSMNILMPILKQSATIAKDMKAKKEKA